MIYVINGKDILFYQKPGGMSNKTRGLRLQIPANQKAGMFLMTISAVLLLQEKNDGID